MNVTDLVEDMPNLYYPYRLPMRIRSRVSISLNVNGFFRLDVVDFVDRVDFVARLAFVDVAEDCRLRLEPTCTRVLLDDDGVRRKADARGSNAYPYTGVVLLRWVNDHREDPLHRSDSTL